MYSPAFWNSEGVVVAAVQFFYVVVVVVSFIMW